MLMDLFFQQAMVARKRRIHFHAFMQEAHARIHAWKKANADGSDPIPPLADAIAAEAALLCFDEFQVNDIADAMILGRLFTALFDRGVVMVCTSNIVPDALFAGQPGRDAFLPFIGLLKQKLDVLMLDGGQDYRRTRLVGVTTWHVPADGRAERALDAAFIRLAEGAPAGPRTLSVMGPALALAARRRLRGALRFRCVVRPAAGRGRLPGPGHPFRGAGAGWRASLSPANYDVARRFIVLIDAFV